MKSLLLLFISLQFVGIGQASALSDTVNRAIVAECHTDTVQVYGMQASFRFARIGSDSLSLCFSASLPAASAALPDEALTYTPVLAYNNHRVCLPPIVVNGDRQKNYYPRMRVLDYMQRIPSPYTVINCTAFARRKRVADTIQVNYLHRLPFASWMGNASLRLVATGQSGRRQYPSDSVTLRSNLRLSVPALSDTVYLYRDTCYQQTVAVEPEAVAVEPDILQEAPLDSVSDSYGSLTFRLWFRQGQQETIPMLYNNDKEIERMRLVIRQLGTRLTRVDVLSCSSPEGTYFRNQQLTRARGLVVKHYLYSVLLGFHPDNVRLSESPENWEELERLLQQGDKPYRDQALSIIRNVPIFAFRETRLMELQQGEPYQDMLANYFPLLRYVDVTLVCDDDKQNTQSHEVEPIHNIQP